MKLPGGQFGGLAALLIALAIGALALLLRVPAPPDQLPAVAPAQATTQTEHLGIGAACSRTWQPIADLADAVREPIVNTPTPVPTDGGEAPVRPLTPLNWRYVGLATVRDADGQIVPAAFVRVDGIQRVLVVGDKVPAPGAHEVEILEITPEHIKIKRGEAESEIPLDDEMRLMEERGFGV
ncbi:MAG: hypothetical protein KDA20_04085 [Phycisphaerales bacterium]|nr:hypothetical protein [Phycisphaerales bacterium]